jgi:CheY-like chemotaxis protein
MEAIGTLAGGIAHDFNNLLTAIMGFGHLLRLRTSDEKDRRYIEHIIAASERATSLTKSLLTFSRKQIINLKPVNLNEIVRMVESLLNRIIGEEIEFRTMLEECHDMTVLADSGLIEQVLMNLATNARDAMPDGGKLIIHTERVDISAALPGSIIPPGGYAVITISDTGAGMSEETRQRIFEPFFTTKEPGKGTGLGLSMVHGIIKQHNGEITVYSEEGCGTTFRIYLKRYDLAAAGPEAIADIYPAGGQETILIGEDDPAVRRYFQTVLEGFGYTVIMAIDGEDAVAKFMENSENIHLVILDVIMPKKTGKAAYEVIRRIRGDVPVIFSSGYSTEIISQKGIIGNEIPFITKPISPHLLLSKLREVLS